MAENSDRSRKLSKYSQIVLFLILITFTLLFYTLNIECFCYDKNSVDTFNQQNVTYSEEKFRECGCSEKPFINLYCDPGKFYDLTPRKCVSYDGIVGFQAKLYQDPRITVNPLIHFNLGKTLFVSKMMLVPADVYRLLDDGKLNDTENNKIFEQHQYSLIVVKNKLDISIAFSIEKENESIMQGVSILCYSSLLATFSIFTFIPQLKEVYGNYVLYYLLNLNVGCLIQNIQHNFNINSFVCQSIGGLTLFTFLSSFFWLNVLAFDIWWHLRRNNYANEEKQSRNFWFYLMYAHGIPFYITLVAYTQNQNSHLSTPVALKPHFGSERCFIEENPKIFYLYAPFLSTMIVNIILVVLASDEILKKSDSDNSNVSCEKVKISTLRVLIAMTCVLWCIEPITWVIGIGMEWKKYLLIIYISQGFVVFTVFAVRTYQLTNHRSKTQNSKVNDILATINLDEC